MGHTATRLLNGKVLVVGGATGWGTGGAIGTAELYDSGGPTSVDDSQFFVTQHYRDFLSREPDAAGLQFWTSEITSAALILSDRGEADQRVGSLLPLD